MGFVFVGIFVTSFGASQTFICSGNPPGTCPGSLDELIAVLGACLMIIGFAMMLFRRRPPPPLRITVPES
jgi:hypothetical protein